MPPVRARYDIYSIEPDEYVGRWVVKGRLYDPTGSYAPEKVVEGDYMICMDYNVNSEVVYDRFVVKSVRGHFENFLDVVVGYEEDYPIQGRSEQPRSGSFPFVSSVLDRFTNPASCEILQFEPHYEAAIEYYNLLSSSNFSRLIDWGTYTADSLIEKTIAPGLKLVTINVRNTGPAITLTITRVDDGYEVAYIEVGENADAVQSINIAGISGTSGFSLVGNTWNENSVHITVNVETIFLP